MTTPTVMLTSPAHKVMNTGADTCSPEPKKNKHALELLTID